MNFCLGLLQKLRLRNQEHRPSAHGPNPSYTTLINFPSSGTINRIKSVIFVVLIFYVIFVVLLSEIVVLLSIVDTSSPPKHWQLGILLPQCSWAKYYYTLAINKFDRLLNPQLILLGGDCYGKLSYILMCRSIHIFVLVEELSLYTFWEKCFY